jgi:hypothetical protein
MKAPSARAAGATTGPDTAFINQDFWQIHWPLPDRGLRFPEDMTETHPQNRR